MKLFSVLGATPFLYGVHASSVGDWCRESGKTDVFACEEAGKQWRCVHNDADCYQRNFDLSFPEDRNVAEDDFVSNEFLSSINDDPMMQEVLGSLNEIEAQLEKNGYVAPVNDEESGHIDEQALASSGRSIGGNSTLDLDSMNGMNQEGVTLRRFVELKQLVSWLQPKDKRISRYCFYGCWCLPEGAHSFIAGEGHPVDLVDRACQLFWFCYQCAKQEMTANVAGKQRTCDPEKTKYTFRFKYNKRKPNDYKDRDVICKDNWYNPMDTRDKWKSNCAKAFCECDRGIAMRLYKSWKHWDKSRHRIWSQRVTQCPRKTNCENMPIATARQRADREACLKKGCLFIVSERCLYGAGGANDEDSNPICCGVYEDDGSRWEMRDHGGRYACCNHNVGTGFGDKLPWNGAWYNTITHCCHNGAVESAGGPNC